MVLNSTSTCRLESRKNSFGLRVPPSAAILQSCGASVAAGSTTITASTALLRRPAFFFFLQDSACGHAGGNFRQKSNAAQRREDEAKRAFDGMRAATEEGAAKDKDSITVDLLEPSTHLTQPCWTAFNRYVKAHAGWSAKRRIATDEEKKKAKEKRKGKCYFISVTFNPRAAAVEAPPAPAKAAADAAPPAKKPKIMGESTNAQPEPVVPSSVVPAGPTPPLA